MSKIVYKYEILHGGMNSIDFEKGAKFLHVGMQGEKVMIWVEQPLHQDPAERTKRMFCIVGTGFEFPNTLEHRGTVQPSSGFVWHLYEAIK